MAKVIVKLRDNGGSFTDPSQKKSLRAKGVAALELTPLVAKAIKSKALTELKGEEGVKALEAFYKLAKKDADEAIKALPDVHAKLSKNDTPKRADQKIKVMKESLKANLKAIEKDLEIAGSHVKATKSADIDSELPDGTPTKEWTVKQIKEWLDNNEVEYTKSWTEAQLLETVATYLEQVEFAHLELTELEDTRAEYKEVIKESAPEDMSVEDMKKAIEAKKAEGDK